MKRYLHFYIWLAAVIMMMCSMTTVSVAVSSFSELKIGSVVKINPVGYNYDANALACNGNGSFLTSYKEAGAGYLWTIEDAGDNYIYLKNELGCYWAYQGISSSQSLTCTTDKNAAVKIGVTSEILAYFDGVPALVFNFWNKENVTTQYPPRRSLLKFL